MRYCKNCNQIIPDGEPYCRNCAPPDATPDDNWAFSPLGGIVYVEEDLPQERRVSVERMEQQPKNELTETQQFNMAFDFNDLTLVTEAVKDPNEANTPSASRASAPHTTDEERRQALHTLLRDIKGDIPQPSPVPANPVESSPVDEVHLETAPACEPVPQPTEPEVPEAESLVSSVFDEEEPVFAVPVVDFVSQDLPASQDDTTEAHEASQQVVPVDEAEPLTESSEPSSPSETPSDVSTAEQSSEDISSILFSPQEIQYEEEEEEEETFSSEMSAPQSSLVPDATQIAETPVDAADVLFGDNDLSSDEVTSEDAASILFGDETTVQEEESAEETKAPNFAVFDGTPAEAGPQTPREKERNVFRANESTGTESGTPASLESWLTQHDKLDFDHVDVELPEPPVAFISRKEPGALEKELKAQASQPSEEDVSRPYGKLGVTIIVVLLLGFLVVVGLSVSRLFHSLNEEELVARELAGTWLSHEFSLRDEPEVALREHLTVSADGGFTTVCYRTTEDPDGYRNGSWEQVYNISGITEWYVADSVLITFSYQQGGDNYYFIREVLSLSDDELVIREYYDETKEDYYDMVFSRVTK